MFTILLLKMIKDIFFLSKAQVGKSILFQNFDWECAFSEVANVNFLIVILLLESSEVSFLSLPLTNSEWLFTLLQADQGSEFSNFCFP